MKFLPNPWVILAVFLAIAGAGGSGILYGRHQRGLECAAAVDTSVIDKLRADLQTSKNNEILLRTQLDDLQKEKDDLEKQGEAYESGLNKDSACPATQRDIDAD